MDISGLIYQANQGIVLVLVTDIDAIHGSYFAGFMKGE